MGDGANTIMHHHEMGLVVLSILIAIVAGYAALDLAQRAARAADPEERRRRLLIAAATMGLGIWTMHFLGMMALDLGIPVDYQPGLVALSLLVAVAGAAVALQVVTRSQASFRSVFLGAALMGSAVAAMHYTGMASMRMPAHIEWSTPLVVLSLVIAYGASLLALAIVFRMHAGQRWRRGSLVLAALAFGLAVAGLHYVGMFAATFQAEPGAAGTSGGGSTELIALFLGIATVLMLVALLFSASLDRQRAAFGRDLAVIAEMMRGVVRGENARDSICVAAYELIEANFVALLEVGADGELVVTASHGEAPFDWDREDAGTALGTGTKVFRSGLDNAHATLYEPITLEGSPVGVLFLVWRRSLRNLSDRAITAAGLLAAEASYAIDRSDMVRRLERQARTDDLTELPNRRTVTSELARRLAAAEGSEVAVAMLDLDHFKSFNDRYGHHGGDRLLEAAAVAWSAQLREVDMIGRYGGEEFLVVLPQCGATEAVATADRLRTALPGGVTSSAGVALWDGLESSEELVARADSALYAAKRNGRDRTELAPGPKGPRATFTEAAVEPALPAEPFGRFVTERGIRTFLDGLADAFALLDPEGRIRDWNQAAESMLGWSLDEAEGAQLAQLLDCDAITSEVERVAAGEADAGSRPIELEAPRRNGEAMAAEVRLFLVEADDSSRIGALIRDVSDRRSTERRLDRFEAIIDSSDDAVISGSMDGCIETWNPAAERLYGYTAAEIIGKDISILRPAGDHEGGDLERRRAVAEGRVVSIQSRERRRDGTLVDVEATIAPLRDDAGTIVGFGVIARDVSERTAANARFALANAQFEGAFDAAAIGMALVSTDGEFLAVNPALCSLLKRESTELLSKSFQELTHPEDLESDLELLERTLAGEMDSYQLSKRYLLPDGGIVWGLLTVTVVRDADGEPLHFVSQIQDIVDRKTAEGELRRYAKQLEALSSQDPLTGLCNRAGFFASLEEELRVLAAGGEGCSVLMISVDGGDSSTTAAVGVLEEFARDEDLAAHLGGGELVLLLPGVDEETAASVLERAERALDGLAVSLRVRDRDPGRRSLFASRPCSRRDGGARSAGVRQERAATGRPPARAGSTPARDAPLLPDPARGGRLRVRAGRGRRRPVRDQRG